MFLKVDDLRTLFWVVSREVLDLDLRSDLLGLDRCGLRGLDCTGPAVVEVENVLNVGGCLVDFINCRLVASVPRGEEGNGDFLGKPSEPVVSSIL